MSNPEECRQILGPNSTLTGKFRCLLTTIKFWFSLGTLHIISLCGRRGLLAVHDTFKDVKLKGKGFEKENLDLVLKKMEHWAYRLFPKLPFDDCIERVEKLGIKKPVQVYEFTIATTIFTSDLNDTNNDEACP